MRNDDPPWKQFERAVADFIAAIGNDAKVTHDAILPDEHTGHPRQRDIWVEWSFGAHFPVKALVSCKRLKTVLTQEDIDHFKGEFISSGANIGIIYSKSGFNSKALEKAKVLGFHCCRFYENEPADIPRGLALGLAYNFRPRFRISVTGNANEYAFSRWDQVLALPSSVGNVLDAFEIAFERHQALDEGRWQRARHGSSFVVETSKEGLQELYITLEIADRAFLSNVKYNLLNGSYNLLTGGFLGSQTTPWVDTESLHPGPGWDEVSEIPEQMPEPSITIFMHADSRALLEAFGRTVFSVPSGS